MFRELSNGIVSHSDGFTVDESSGLSSWLIYREGERSLHVFRERGAGGYTYYLDCLLRWDKPHAAEVIPTARQELIKDRIVAALDFRGYRYVLQR